MARRPGSYTGGMGMSSMLKEGSKHFSGVEEATLKNIQACKELAATVRTSLGPNGMCARGSRQQSWHAVQGCAAKAGCAARRSHLPV